MEQDPNNILNSYINNNLYILKGWYKSQVSLHKDLVNDAQRLTQICEFMHVANVKMEEEIKNGQQMLKSSTTSLATIKEANLVIKENNRDVKQRRQDLKIRIGNFQQKHETQWLICKKRIESMDVFVQYNNAVLIDELSRNKINDFNLTIQELQKQIKIKKEETTLVDRIRIIEVAKYMKEENVILEEEIRKKQNDINNLKKSIKLATKDRGNTKKNILYKYMNEDDPLPKIDLGMKVFNSTLLACPKLGANRWISQLQSSLNDSQKDMKTYIQNIQYEKPKSILEPIKENSADNFAAAYNMTIKKFMEFTKSINVVEDIEINKEDAINIVSNMNSTTVKIVELIQNDKTEENIDDINMKEIVPTNPEPNKLEDEDDIMMIPPTQFRDCSQDLVEPIEPQKKRVTFDLPAPEVIAEFDHNEADVVMEDANDSDDVTKDYSCLRNYTNIKDSVKDLSPKYVYAKEEELADNPHADEPVTSKFFVHTEEVVSPQEVVNNDEKEEMLQTTGLPELNLMKTHEVDEMNSYEISEVMECEPAAGAQLGDSMNITINTTGFEEQDNVPCFDPSLLLSPKGDFDNQTDNSEANAESSNFFTSVRKGCLSIFNNTNPSQDKPESSDQSGNNFTFDFGGSKNKRGGLFNMFN